nr:uncharacterized protein LOC109184888 [Ipomoea batatas]
MSPSEKLGEIVPTNYFTKDFVNCCTNLELTDAPSIGSFFTWANRRVKAKLDRVLIDPNWLNGNFNCWVEFKEFEFMSDHCPMIIKLFTNSEATNRPFKFFNMWISHPKFKTIVKDSWDIFIDGTHQYSFAMHLKALKSPLKRLNKEDFGHISERAVRANEDYSSFAQNFDVLTASEDDRIMLQNLRNRACYLADAERQFFNQKLKLKSLIDGDKGTKYFHDLVKKSNRDKSITCIIDENEQPTTSLTQVWTRIRDIIGFQKKTIAIRSTIKWIHRLHKGSRRQDHGVAIALACSIYHIWRFRNLVVHEAVGFNLEGLPLYLVSTCFVIRWIPGDAPSMCTIFR